MVFKDISNYSNEEICEMIDNLNNWNWDERVGEKPEGFDQMPWYNVHWWHRLIKRKTRQDYIRPAMGYLQQRVTMKEFYFFINVTHSKRMTSEQFEKWWGKKTPCGSLSLIATKRAMTAMSAVITYGIRNIQKSRFSVYISPAPSSVIEYPS